MNMNKVEKKSFTVEEFTFESGKTIPVTLGYETYGKMNEDKSNVILVNHYFSGTSHAAGKYKPDDSAPGYWDELIGPGKAVDTDKFFIISMDNFANVQVKNSNVITTGPRSINPETGKRYGLDFPQFNYRDMVRVQQEFLTNQLGIEKLYAVMGPSAGGFISINWSILYPEMVERLIGVITNPFTPIHTAFNVCQHAMRAIELDPNWKNGNYEDDEEPKEGTYLATQLMNVGAYSSEYFEENYQRDTSETKPYKNIEATMSFERKLHEVIKDVSSVNVDASHWYYTSRATMLHDISHGYKSFEEALSEITADVLMISSTSDLLMPTIYNRQMVNIMKNQNQEVDLIEIESINGHMAGIFDTHLFDQHIKNFLS